MKFIIIVAVVTGIYVCAMDVVSKFTSSIDFSRNNTSIVEVSISGEVSSPGTYLLPNGATLKDLVAYAGGFTNNADVTDLTASEILITGKNYYIPSAAKEEISVISVSINTGSVKQLITVPGIGNTLAARIVAYRLEHGEFASLDDLCNVKGIKETTLEKIKPYLTLE